MPPSRRLDSPSPGLSLARLTMLAVLAVTPACGDDGAAGPDAAPGPYDDPGDFPRDGCAPGTLADLVGRTAPAILHLEVRYPDYPRFIGSTALRLDPSAGGGAAFTALLAGEPAEVRTSSADDLVVRQTFADGTGVRALDLCGRDAAGELRGHYVLCRDGECLAATVRGKVVERLAESEASGLALLGEHGGRAAWPGGITVNVRVLADVAYLANYGDGLRLVDVRDPAAMSDLGHLPVEYPDAGEIYNDVKLVNRASDGRRFALMASNRVGVVVVDVSTPAAPTIAAHFGTPANGETAINVHTLALVGTRAYLGNPGVGLEIWDVADPATPVLLGLWSHPSGEGYLHDLYVVGDRAYLAYWDAGLQVLDVAAPATPRLLGTYVDYGELTSHSVWTAPVGGRTLAVHGDEQYGAHLRVVDVTEDAAFLTELGQWQTRPEVSIHNLMIDGELALAAHYQDGVRVIDLGNPRAPTTRAWFNTWPGPAAGYGESFYEGAVGIDYEPGRRRLYVADSHRGLLVLALAP